jgi:molecular chaperone GrpE
MTQQSEPRPVPGGAPGADDSGSDQPAGGERAGMPDTGTRQAERRAAAEGAGQAVSEPDRDQDEKREPGEGEEPESEADVLAADVARLEDRWRRTLADLDNLRKRCAKEIERERALERGRVASAWLAIVDHLELALAHADGNAEAVIEGVRAVRDQAVDLLAKLGYPRHDEVGVPFDPARHEAVSVVDASDESDAAPGTVVRVMRPGYGDAEWQLRPAAVVVARQRE